MQPNAVAHLARPKYLSGVLFAFIGISAANVMPPFAQFALYLVGLVAVCHRPHVFPRLAGVVLLLAGGYVVLSRLALGIELDGALRLVRPCFEGLLLAHVLFKWCRIRDFRSAALVLGGVIAIQFLAAVLMAIYPAGRFALIESIYADESYQNAQFLGALLFRGYGISRHHLYGLSLACGLSATLLLVAASIERAGLWRIVLAALAGVGILVVAVNARVGFVPVVVCYLVGTTFLFDKFYPKHMLSMAIMLLAPVVYFGAIYLGEDFETLWTWLGAGVAQFGASDQADTNTLSDLRGMVFFSPNVVELVFGAGRACASDDACHSDIGFVRALQEGGAVFLLLVLYLYWHLNQHLVRFFRRTIDLRNGRRRRALALLAIVVHCTFIAAMIKGEAFGPNDYSRLIVTLACLGVLVGGRSRHRRATSPGRQAIAERAAAAVEPVPAA